MGRREDIDAKRKRAKKGGKTPDYYLTDADKAFLRSEKASPEEKAAAEEAAKVKPQGVTQEMLDEALSQGINISRGTNLAKISAVDQQAQAQGSIAQQTIQELLTAEKQQEGRAAAEGFEEARQEQETPLRTLQTTAAIKQGAERALSETLKPLLTFSGIQADNDRIEKASDTAVTMMMKFGGRLPVVGGTFDSIIQTQDQMISETRENGANIVKIYRDGASSPEEALFEIEKLRQSINQSYGIAHSASRYSGRASLEGMGDVERKYKKALTDLEAKRAEILRIAASQRAGINLGEGAMPVQQSIAEQRAGVSQLGLT